MNQRIYLKLQEQTSIHWAKQKKGVLSLRPTLGGILVAVVCGDYYQVEYVDCVVAV
jgi:hypothetical protein